MQWLRSAMLVFLVYLLIAVMGILGAPVVLWSRAWTRSWAKLYARGVFALSWCLCGLRVETRGPVPSGAVVVASKHQSLLDVLMLQAVLPEAHFVMKRELLWAPVFGLYALRSGSIWIAREKRGEGKTMLRRLQGKHRGGGQIVIYPQGTRVPPGVVMPYRRGAAMAYESFGLPMVLAATNVGWFWPKKGILKRPGTAVLEFLETLPPGLPRAEVMSRMEAMIETASDRLGEEAAKQLGLDRAG
ncbi:MAG TPA: lysophospholipid acyltransferase family protein [Thermohalobaculum sp.]|nr:lysophospholipid acyltransferase family protein [Thermohalobaculum sp.]